MRRETADFASMMLHAILHPAPAARPFQAPTRRHAVRFAWQGFVEAWKTQPNLRLHSGVAATTVGLGFWLHLSRMEWLLVSCAIGLVIVAELINTAVERTIDLVVGSRPDPLARQIKDIAAACVLAAVCLAVTIGILTFGPHLLLARLISPG